jgi:hypothetical protein
MAPAKVALADAEGDLRKVSFLEEEQEELLSRIAALEALQVSDAAQSLAAALEADRGTVRVLEATRAGGMVEARERRRIIIKGSTEWVEATAAATVVEGARLSIELKEKGKEAAAVLERCKAAALEQSQLRRELELCDGAGAAMADRVRVAERRACELRASAARLGLERSDDAESSGLRSGREESDPGHWRPEALRAARERQEVSAERLQRLRAARAEVDATAQVAASALSACLVDWPSSASQPREWDFSEAVPASLEELSPSSQASFARAALRRLHGYRQRLRLAPQPPVVLSSDQHLAAAGLIFRAPLSVKQARTSRATPTPRGLAGPWGVASAESSPASGRSLFSDESRGGSSFGGAPATGAFAPLLPPLAPPEPHLFGGSASRETGESRRDRRHGPVALISKTTSGAMREAGLLETTPRRKGPAKRFEEAPLRRLEYSLTPAREKQQAKKNGRPFRASGSLGSITTTAAPSSGTYHGGSFSSQLASPLSSQVL